QLLGSIRCLAVNVRVGSQLLRQHSVVRAASDGRNVITKLVGELDAKMPQAADALHGNKIARQRAAVAERVVGGDAGVEQRSRIGVSEAIWDRHQRFHWGKHVFLISAVVADAGNFHVPAVAEISTTAFAAGAVMPAMPADSDTLSCLPCGNAIADF